MDKKQELLNQIMLGNNPVCLHILGQGLVNTLCAIIYEQQLQISRLSPERPCQNTFANMTEAQVKRLRYCGNILANATKNSPKGWDRV